MPVYFSEIRFENNSDFVEIVATDGEDVSGYSIAVYDDGGDVQYTHSLSGEFETSIAGNDGYLVDISDGLPDMGQNWGVALIDDLGNVVQFISGDGDITAKDGPAAGEISDGQGNMTSGGESLETSDGGLTYYAQAAPNPGVIPCFAPGTLIATPDGSRAVEDLRAGDEVLTEDGGPQTIRWVNRSKTELEAGDDGGAPILIKADALGPGLPEHDLIFSPNRRILLGGAGQFTGLLAGEALAPAKAFTCIPRIRRMRGRKRITWYHFAFDRHAIVQAEGLRVESLLLAEMVFLHLSELETMRVRRLFPRQDSDGHLNGPVARPLLNRKLAEKLLRVRDVCDLFNYAESVADTTLQSRSR